MSRYCVAPVTLTLEPCYPTSNPKGSYMSRRTSSLVHVGTLRENSRGRMRTRDTWVFGGSTVFPWALTLTLGWGKVEVPPDSLSTLGGSRGYSLGNSKKGKKINFFCTVFKLKFIVQVSNPNVTSGNVCPTLVVWGVPFYFSWVRFWNQRQVLLIVF